MSSDALGYARNAVRWILIALICAIAFVAAAWLLRAMQPRPQAPRQVSVDDLLAAVYMPFNANGVGSQIISDTQLTVKLAPYPASSSITSTLILVANGAETVTPTLMVSSPGQSADEEFAMARQADGSYMATGDLFGRPGQWRVRVDVYLGHDAAPAIMLMLVDVR